jgi:molybdopterin converting factor small subunit
MMTVTVKLYGTLRRHRPATISGVAHHPFTLGILPGSRVNDLAAELGIDESLVSAVAVNGEAAGDVLLHDGDEVRFFPPSAGG